MKRNRRTIIVTIASILVAYLLWFVMPKLIVDVEHPLIKIAKNVLGRTQKKNIQFHPLEKIITKTSPEGYHIKASWVVGKRAKKNIILVHGIRSNKSDFATKSQQMLDSGYNLLAIDLRGHGISDGTYCTFGAKEKEDISMFVDFLKVENNLPIGIWGRSLGGAVALQTLATDKRISFGIIESTFSSFDKICKDYFKKYVGFRLDFLLDFAIWRAGLIANFNTEIERPKESCARIEQDILMAHGVDDKFISIKYGKENYEALVAKNKQFIEVPQAGHNDLWQVGSNAYFDSVFYFIENIRAK